MELTIFVPDDVKPALEQRAHERGCSDISQYVERLVTTDLLAARPFDEILAPLRQTAQASGVSEDEWAVLFEEARTEVHSERRANPT